jgi:hypothetical protein
MDKPDWSEAPEWAKWLAQDKDGDWYWWQDEPVVLREPFWMPNADDTGEIGLAKPAKFNEVILEWTTNLEQRP